MSWSTVSLPSGSRLFKVHNFTFMHKGANFHLEVDEFSDGNFTGYGEHATDKNLHIESVNGNSVKECLELLIRKIEGRG